MNYLVIPNSFWAALIYLAPVLALLAGLVLAQGLWGARTGWQPMCRKCGHDLRALGAGSGTCPECGADLQRKNAVIAGRPRRRPALLAVGMLILGTAACCSWYLQPGTIVNLRSMLIASMPLEDLFEGILAGSPGSGLAITAIQRESGSMNKARTIPPGKLLDALVVALGRHRDANRGAIAVQTQQLRMMLYGLDRDECARLASLAAEELVASDGQRRDLLEISMAAQYGGGRAAVGMSEAIRGHLKKSETGRRLLLPTLGASSRAVASDALILKPGSIFANTGAQSAFDTRADGEVFVPERAEFVPKEQGAAPVSLLLLPMNVRMQDDVSLRVLIDLPPGKGKLVLHGVVVPSDAMKFGNMPSAAEARAHRAATPHRVETELEVVEPEITLPKLVSDEALVAEVASSCANASFSGRRSGPSMLQVDIFPQASKRGLQRTCGYAFEMIAVQGSVKERIGELFGRGESHSVSGGSLPSSIDGDQPFEIVLRPDPRRFVAERSLADGSDKVLWAEFRLKFASKASAPTVTVATLPEAGAPAELLQGEGVLKKLTQLASMLSPVFIDETAGADSATLVHFNGLPAEAVALAEQLPLCGRLEVRSNGRLVAPCTIVLGELCHHQGSIASINPDQGGRGTLVVRYTPDPSLIQPRGDQPPRYVAMPFELVYEPFESPRVRVLKPDASDAESAADNAAPRK